jgi:hypothetical protein
MRVEFDDGYVVLEKHNEVLFVRYIKFRRMNFPAMLQTLSIFAEAEGCTKIQGVSTRKFGKDGASWLKKLQPLGFYQLPDGTITLDVSSMRPLAEERSL